MSMAKQSGSNGETELQGVIEYDDNTQLYLIRIPKRIKCAELDGVKIKKYSDKCQVDALDFPAGHHVLDVNSAVDTSAFRALVKKSDGAVQVADAFAGSLTMRRVFGTPSTETNSPAVCRTVKCFFDLLLIPCRYRRRRMHSRHKARTWRLPGCPSVHCRLLKS